MSRTTRLWEILTITSPAILQIRAVKITCGVLPLSIKPSRRNRHHRSRQSPHTLNDSRHPIAISQIIHEIDGNIGKVNIKTDKIYGHHQKHPEQLFILPYRIPVKHRKELMPKTLLILFFGRSPGASSNVKNPKIPTRATSPPIRPKKAKKSICSIIIPETTAPKNSGKHRHHRQRSPSFPCYAH